MATTWGCSSSSTTSTLTLLLIGPKRTGKSSVGNTLLGREALETWGGGGVAVVRGEAEGRQLTVVDTCGWAPGPGPVPRREKLELLRGVALCQPGPHALLLVLPALAFGEDDQAALRRRMELLTEGAWRHTLVVFTLGDQLRGRSTREDLRAGGQHLEWLLAKCRYRYCVLDNKASGARQQVAGLLDRVEDMVVENGGWHYSLHMYCRLEEEWRQREQEIMQRV